MTIELSPPASPSPKAAASNHAQGAKASKAAGDAAPDAGNSGFMAILGALGDAVQEDAAPAIAATDAATPVDASLVAVPFDATALLQQNPQIAAAQAAAGVTAPGGQDARFTSPLPDATVTPATVAGAAAQDRARLNLAAANAVSAAPEDSQVAGESLTSGLQRAGAHAKPGKDAAALAATDANAASSTAVSTSERVEPKDLKLLSALEQARAAPAARAAEPILAPLLAKLEKPQSEREAFAAKNSEPTYSGMTLGVSSPDFSQSATQAATAVPPEMQVAEQVTYWVSQNVQNAEMKLDGLGQNPVEVSISVQGNEAQITFRSDEAQTRGVLESAGAHLKDMLQREGMVLTGVSVGTSGGDASGAGGERRGRAPVRQVLIAPLDAAAAPAARRAGLAAGRSVDLFV